MGDKKLAHRFVIGQIDNGAWLAVSAHPPYFCFEGDSDAIVAEKANRALAFYYGVTAGHVVPDPKIKGKREKTLSTFRTTRRIEREAECV